ncbi:DUF3800 domain-containing protein [Variovorax arabinosiphilus]|uniref:DUF3800 domain-containing protein n=1 Tax=Variovorax arabinosiphilus TaxID=3053498 RepID=UPI0025769E79|nr:MULTISPECIES: DUF3800 domain-containing protein [unclassified Variovorax]MDM0119014.1 DUF3800 domain-containing protein [Variovorax sp. J2L1-78]MDM0129440.1 DUF3800 domain-containing protein [Variovorax sp. J2L1-63]MDM0232774.1 DUF3800 domain-containing protein [Variovorax sp. J2R1-6]
MTPESEEGKSADSFVLGVLDLEPFRSPELVFHPNSQKSYTLFYDETNNIRKLRFTETGLSDEGFKCFVLGGIALEPGAKFEGLDELRTALHVPANVDEMKFKHVAWGTYERVLKSPRLGVLLRWLLDRPLYVHYSNFSVLNWSILDLVDCLLTHERFANIRYNHLGMKSELHAIVRMDPLGYFRLLRKFDYPNVDPTLTSDFLGAVWMHLYSIIFKLNRERNRSKEEGDFRNEDSFMFFKMLSEAANDPATSLKLLAEEDPETLIGSFAPLFLNRMATFVNAEHVFDEEPSIEEQLDGRRVVIGESDVSYRFTDSKTEPGIVVSDLVCGFLGKHFTFIEQHSIEELDIIKAGLNQQQRANLELFAKLIDKANDECQCFIFNSAVFDSGDKHLWFVDGTPYPPELRF